MPSTAPVQSGLATAQSVYAPDGQNLNPFVFFALDQRTDLRPQSWEFVNPLAPPSVTQEMATRWGRIAPAVPLLTGTPLTKDLAPYWEVPLKPELIDQLGTMDVCYISASGALRMTYQDRELLRRLVDAGVLLWIDDGGGLRFPNPGDALFFPIDFNAEGGTAQPVLTANALLDGIYRLQPAESARLSGGEGVVVVPTASEGAQLYDPTRPGLARTTVLNAVVGYPDGTASVAAAQYGSGFLLATGGNLGAAITNGVGHAAHALADVQSGVSAAVKLIYNAISWTDNVTHVLKNPRRTGSGGSTLAGSLERWSYTNSVPLGYAPWLQPLIARNQVFNVIPPGRGPNSTFLLQSFEVNPINDFDGSGRPDQGPLDLTYGLNYDLISASPLQRFSWISGLAYGEQAGVGYLFATGGTGGSLDTASAGTTFIQAFQVPTATNPNFVTNSAQPGLTWTPPATSKDVNVRTVWSAPAYFDGLLIAAGGTQGNSIETGNGGVGAVGDMRALRLENGQLVEQWHYPQGNAPEVGPIVGPVVVANLQDPRTGATDTTVLYTSLTIASSPGGLGGIVMHTAGEPLVTIDDGRTWQPTRRVENWDPNQWFDIRVIDNLTGLTAFRYTPATQSVSPVQFNVENQQGRIRLPAPVAPNRFTVVAEYSLLQTREGSTGGVIRRYWVPAFNLPGGNLPSSGVSAGPTVDADGNVYMATGNGYIASVRFVAGTPVINWKARAEAAASGQFLGQQQIVEPFKPGRLIDHLYVSTPAWRNGVLYLAGRDGVVYAFETKGDFTFRIPFTPGKPPMSPNRPNSVVLYSNEGDALGTGEPPRTNRVPPDNFQVNVDAGTVTLTNMRNVTLDLSRALAPQAIPNPGIGNRYGIPINVDYIDVDGKQQSDVTYIPLNLLYKFQTGIGNGADSLWQSKYVFESSPVVAGDHVFVIGNRGQAVPLTQQGPAVLFDLPADPRKLDNQFIAGTDVGAWRAATPDSTRPAGWMVNARLISSTPVLAPPAISDDLMVIATGEGVTAYKSAHAIVADANRVLEIDASGHAAASLDATTKLTAVGSDVPIPADRANIRLPASTAFTTVAKHLDRPAAVRHLSRDSSIASIFYNAGPTETGLVGEHSEMSADSLLTADTGNNRVVETNPAGKVVWELTSFQDPLRLLPPGEPLTLSEPLDVQRWVDTEAAPSASSPLLVIHTLVADAGNTRVIEIVDKILYQQGNYSPNSFVTIPGQKAADGSDIRWSHVLVWTSQTNGQGLRFRYRTAQRIYRSDANGALVPNQGVSANTYPRPVMSDPPYLPKEPYESLTMATISNARVFYAENKQDPHYGDTLRNIPQALPGGDSIVFLRSNRTNTATEPFWVQDPTSSSGFKYIQGTIGHPAPSDPNTPAYPIISDIWTSAGGEQIIHSLNGVTSLERTLRVNPADRTLPGPQRPRAIYYLIADSAGVFEFRYDPNQPVDPPSAQDPFPRDHGPRLAWAFTNDDYNWVTGGGSGNPNAVRPSPTGSYTGGRTFTAASARLMTNGQVLIASRTAGNPPPTAGAPALGGEIMSLRITDYARAPANGPSWIPDAWVQRALNRPLVLPSITWRSPAPIDPLSPPQPISTGAAFNPLDIGNTYLPDQPAFADLVF